MRGVHPIGKILLGILAAVLILFVAGLFAGQAYLQSDAFRQRLETRLTDKLNRPVSLRQNMQVGLGLPPTLTLHGLQIANPDWAAEQHFLDLQTLVLTPALRPFFTQTRIDLRVVSAGPGVLSHGNGPQGQSNWPRPTEDPDFDRVRLRHLAGATIEALRIRSLGEDDDFALIKRLAISDAGDGRLALDLQGQLLDKPMQAQLELPGIERIDETDAPLTLGINKARWAESDLSGELTLDRGGQTPKLSGRLRGEQWAYAASGDDQDKTEGGPPIPDFPLPVGWRNRLGADIEFQVDSLRAGGLTAQNLKSRLRIEGSRLTIDPLRLELDGAELDTRLSLEASQLPPVLSYAGRIDQLNLRQSFDPLLTGDGAQGYVNTQFDLSGRGANTREAITHINGDLRLVLEQGRLSTALLNRMVVDLGRLLGRQSEEETPEGTPIRCLAAQFSADNGLVTIKQLIADTERVLLVGDGSINLREGKIHVSLDPSTVGIDPTSAGIPIDIRGPLTQPKGEIDISATFFKAGRSLVAGLLGPAGAMADLLGLTEPGETGCRATLRDYMP